MLRINQIYRTFMGEVNAFGIGAPAVFVRTAGCHLRCYLDTFGVLCDTPHALEKGSGDEYDMPTLLNKINSIGKDTVKLICLTGGDPLWRKKEDLIEFFEVTGNAYYSTVVETSGSLSWLPYVNKHYSPFWVIDHKLKSAGVKNPSLVLDKDHIGVLDHDDYIKFVIANEEDFDEALQVTDFILANNPRVKVAFGPLYGTGAEMTFWDINNKLNNVGYLSPQVVLNLQLHKLHPLYTDAMQI